MNRKHTLFVSLCLLAAPAVAQTYLFDGDLATSGIQNGSGAWSTDVGTATNLRWLKDSTYSAWDNSGLAIADFGNTTSTAGGTLTLAGEIRLAGMNFNALGAPLGSTAYGFTGGTLNFGNGGLINVANAASGGSLGGQWITFNSTLKGTNLTFQKSGGSTIAFVRINAANPDLTGTLTLKSAPGATSGIYASIASPAYISGLSSLVVEAGSVYNPTGAGTYAVPVTFAGTGASNYGAIRVDPSNATFSGNFTLSADGRFHTHINTVNTVISGGIGETGGSWSFNRTAYAPVNTLLPLTTTYAGTSTYTGATVLGRALSVVSTSENAATEGGINLLDFTAATAPMNNMLYHSSAPGALQLMGGLATTTVLQMNGAAGKANSQAFASTTAQQSATAITLVSGFGGSMSADLGAISRTGNGVLALTAPLQGRITGTVGGSTEGLIGTWATFRSADGKSAGWAGLTNGIAGVFSGDLTHVTGSDVASIPGYSSAAHLRLSSSSTGDVSFGSGVTDLAGLSMTDSTAPRHLDLAGKTLRLGADGGLQIIQGAQALTIGSMGDSSSLTAGGTDNTPGQIMLTNMSFSQPLTVNSAIINNGSAAVSLNINGTGRTVLTAANSFTGIVTVQSGVLEVQNNQALGTATTAGLTKIMAGASLNLSGGITLGETIQANGHGIGLTGAIRNLSGLNTLTAPVRIQSTTRFTSDSGTLVLAGGFTTQISATSYTFSGSGDIEVRGPITATSGLLNKEGPGTLTLSGTSSSASATTVTNGTLHLHFDLAGAPAANILYTGQTLSTTVGTLNLGGGTLRTTGKVDSASNQAFGSLVLASGASRVTALSTGTGSMELNLAAITRPLGTTLRFDLPSNGAIRTTSGANNALLTGTGGVAYATVGLDDWAATGTAVSGLRTITGLSSINGYTASTSSALAGNADIALNVGTTTLAAPTTVASLRFHQPQATLINQDAPGRLLTTGGILVTTAVGAHASILSVSGLRAAVGSTDLVIHQNNIAAPLTLTGKILNTTTTGGATAVTGLTKAGPGTVVLEYDTAYAAGDYTGATRIQNGALQLVKTSSASISYAIYASTVFTLGSGSRSGKLVLGGPSATAPTTYAVTQYGALRTEGSGTGNAVVGGLSSLSTFLHYVSGSFDFRNGSLGGTGTHENNLNLTISLGTLQLGPANTYKGKTTLLQNTLEVTTLADRGQPSSLGTGDYNATTHIIDIATATTSSQGFTALGTLRYIGDADSVTNRPLNITNTDIPGDVVSVIAVLENTGTGTVKFTAPFTASGSNTVQRILRLGGTNMGANEIVSFSNVTNDITGRVEKTGTGSWILTGASTYSGGTSVEAGTLLATNATGSATGTGDVVVLPGAVLGGSGRIAPVADRSITLTGGTLQIGSELPGTSTAARTASSLTLHTSGTGTLAFQAGSTLAFDLFTGAGLGDNSQLSTAADLAILLGQVNFGTGSILRVTSPTGMTGWAAADQWRLFDWTGLSAPVTGSLDQFDLPLLPAGLAWDTSDLLTSGILSIAFIPEPSRAVLLLLAVLALATRRRRPAVQAQTRLS